MEIVRRVYEAFMRGDTEEALAAYSRDAEWDDTRARPDGKVHQGRDVIAEVIRTWVGAWTHHSLRLERVVDAGEWVVVIYEEQGSGKGSGLEVNTRVGVVMTVVEGKIMRAVFYLDPAEALEAAGLSE